MKKRLSQILAAWLCVGVVGSLAKGAERVEYTVHAGKAIKQVDVRIYGQFLEHIFNSVHGGLWGDQVLNGTLEVDPPSMGRSRNETAGRQASVNAGTGQVNRSLPRGWEFVGGEEEVRSDAENPLNAAWSVRLERAPGASGMPAIRQRHIALQEREHYRLTLYARGAGDLRVTFADEHGTLLQKEVGGVAPEWGQYTVEFDAPREAEDATLTIGLASGTAVNVDQVSLFSAAAIANHNLRPDLYKAVAELRPATIRWPGGSFANHYVWENGIGPAEKRLPHPVVQWNDRDPNQFGTDEFLQMCERLGAEPILVINTGRGVEEALDWLEYCTGDVTTKFGAMRAKNGHAAPYHLHTIEIDNEAWLMMTYPKYLEIVKAFCPAIRAKYPALQLSVCGSYAYDNGPGEGVTENANWDPRLIADAGNLFDVLSPHYYNGLLKEHAPDYEEDPWNYEKFLQSRAELIKHSENPNMVLYVSEWNLTHGRWGNDWRVGLYAGAILNTFEREADIVKMSCPALFLRKEGVTKSWDNALINFDTKGWFPGGNYVVMKLWRDAYARDLLAMDGPERPLNMVATETEDQRTVYLKVVNPRKMEIEAAFAFDSFAPGRASMDVVAPGEETARNSFEQRDRIHAETRGLNVENGRVTIRFPAISAAVVRLDRR